PLPTRRPSRSAALPYTTLFRSSPGQTERTVVVTLRPAPLFGMKEDSPRLEVAPFSNALELLFVIDLSKAQLRRRSFQPGDQSIVDRKSTRLNSSHVSISYAVFC